MARTLTSEKHLTRRQNEIAAEIRSLKRLRAVEIALAALFLIGGLFWRFSLGHGWFPFVLGAFFAFLALGQFVRQAETAGDSEDTEQVRRIKTSVASLLDEKLANDHYILNDLRLQVGREKCWIDHLVVAPSGMFVVNTVAWDGEIFGDASQKAYNWKIRTPDGRVRPARNPVGRALRERRILCNWLKGTDLIWENVRTIVVLADPTVEIDVLNAKDLVCTPDRAIGYINDFCFNTPVLSNPEVESLAKGLNDRTAV